MLTYRHATPEEAALLAELNHQLIQDEGHRNRMTVPQLETRMRNWLKTEYRAVLFEQPGEVVAYALYRPEEDATYLRQFFVRRERRRRGIGLAAMNVLLRNILRPGGRLYLDVLVSNSAGKAFWKAVGFQDYAVTLEMIVRHTDSSESISP